MEAEVRMATGAVTEQAVVGVGTAALSFFKKGNSAQVTKDPEEVIQQDTKHLKCQ